MNYSDFIDLKEKYDILLERRLEEYCSIMNFKKSKFSSNNYYEFPERDMFSMTIEYCSHGIEIKYQRTFSGCGTDSYDFTIDLDILEIEDDEKYFKKLENEIDIFNEEFEENKKLEQDKAENLKNELLEKNELETLATLKAKYE